MNNILKKTIGILSILLVMLLLLILLINNQADIQRIKNISIPLLIILVILTLTEYLINGIMLKVLLEPFNIKVKIKEWLGLSIITTFGNYLTFFRGGTSAKAIYLKKRHNLSYSHFVSSVGAGYVITLLIYGILGIIFSIAMLLYKDIFNLPLFLLFVLIFIASLLIISFTPVAKETSNGLLKTFYNVMSGWNHLKKNKRFILHFSILMILLYFESVIKIFLLYKSLGYNIPFISSAFIALTSNISILVAITPSGIGVREGVIAVTSKLLNIGLKSGIYISALDRAISLILVVILGPIFSFILYKHKPKRPSQTQPQQALP